MVKKIKKNKVIVLLVCISVILLISFISSLNLNDTKIIVCNSINITEPNCTTWWNSLNLSETDLEYNLTVNYITNNTQFNITNITYFGNYSIYNFTNNLTNIINITVFGNKSLDEYIYYNKSEIDNLLSTKTNKPLVESDIKTIVNKIISESEHTTTSVKDIEKGYKIAIWIIGILLLLLIGFLVYSVFFMND